MNPVVLEAVFAIIVAIGCMALIKVGKNGSAVSILSLLVGRFLGKSEGNRRDRHDRHDRQ